MFEDFEAVNITPREFELLVKNWLEMSASNSIKDLKVTHLGKLRGSSGDYEIDVLAEFEVFGGANMKVIIECKKYARRIKRDVMMTLDAKVRDSGAQRGMLFTTSGFQSGAIEYAQQRGLAAIVIQPGYVKYIVNSICDNKKIKEPILTLASEHIGYLYTINEEGYQVASTIDGLEYNPLAEFFEK